MCLSNHYHWVIDAVPRQNSALLLPGIKEVEDFMTQSQANEGIRVVWGCYIILLGTSVKYSTLF